MRHLGLAENSGARWGGAGLQCPGRERGEGGARLLASPSFSLPEILFIFRSLEVEVEVEVQVGRSGR